MPTSSITKACMRSAEANSRKILITGVAGFIGFHLARRLLGKSNDGLEIVGIDNLNDYYDPSLKLARLRVLGVEADGEAEESISEKYRKFVFKKIDITDKVAMEALFAQGDFDVVFHLAAQASARYSTLNPREYLDSNIVGFFNVLEGCRIHDVGQLFYASSLSVYGMSDNVPYTEVDDAARPVSFYAATKRSNELMAHSYASVYGLHVTGLRFFSVYGPWGRPYMFIDAILSGKKIKVFNSGDMYRDFTYIDDVVEGMVRLLEAEAAADLYRIFNIGNSQPVRLLDYIATIERTTGRIAQMEMMPMHPGDVYKTYSDSSALQQAVGFKPSTPHETGVEKTVGWFKNYYAMN